MRIITCSALFFGILFALFSIPFAEPACSGTDTYELEIFDPAASLVKSATTDISPVAGTDCSNTDEDSIDLNVSCSVPGTYTANVTCASCNDVDHNDISSINVLTCYGPESKRFVLRSSTGTDVAAFDSKGYVYLAGSNFSNQGTLNPPSNSYIVRAPDTSNVAYIDNSGNFYFKGSLSTNQSTISPPSNSLIFRNETGADVGYVDSSGNVVLSGKLYFGWTGDI